MSPPRSTLLLTSLMLAAIAATPWFRLNLSASAPRGLYRLTAVPEAPLVAHLMLLTPPASIHPWHWWWLPLLKPVAGLPGDEVCVEEDGLTIRGQDYGPVYTQADGKALPRLTGCLVLDADEVFLASPRPGSLDSRYFGPIKVAALRAQAVPVWTWGD